MTDLAFKACYSDWKLIKTRGVVQVVMEVPLAEADAAYKVLGGMPDVSREQWFGVAALKLAQTEKEKPDTNSDSFPATPQPNSSPAGAKRDEWRDMLPSAQAAIRCTDVLFRTFLCEDYGFDVQDKDQAAIVVRQLCKVESRKEFNTDGAAKVRWQGLDDQFLAWRFADA